MSTASDLPRRNQALDTIAAQAASPRWRGEPGRIETWYATFTDPRTGDGYWIHAETLAAMDGRAEAHGWFAAFPAGGAVVVERFGPEVVSGPPAGSAWFDAAGCLITPDTIRGRAGELRWELRYRDDSPPLYTFPKWAWDRALLPAQQIVPAPTARFDGVVDLGRGPVTLEAAIGGLAHIWGHGHAQRWAWLHADLGGGDVLEVVTAVSRRPGLRLLPPLSFVQLRVGGVDWPGDPLAAAPLLRGRIGLPSWSVSGIVGRRRLRVNVTIPPDTAVELGYRDPDGAPATCTNSERADVDVALDQLGRAVMSADAGRWHPIRRWSVRGTAHAEVGLR